MPLGCWSVVASGL